MRPLASTGAPLGFEAVFERGINLTDPVLIALAKSSFNVVVLWALLGAAVGAAIGYAIHRAKGPGVKHAA